MPMTEAEFSRNRLRHGDVLLNEGQSLELVGRCAMYQGEYPGPCAIQNQLVRFRARYGVSAGFAAQLFRYCQQIGLFTNIALQTTSVAHLGVSRFNRLELAWPVEVSEQEAITEALSDADALIESLERLIAKKSHVKQGTMQELLSGRLRLREFANASVGYKQTEVGIIPRDWYIKTVEEISDVSRGRVISHKEIACSQTPTYPVYSSQTSNNGVMGYIDTFDFEGEYITWTTDGANAGTVFCRSGRFNCTNVCGTIRLRSDNAVFISKVLGRIAPRHVSRNLGNPKLMNDVVKRIKLPLPSTKAEQEAIADVLSDMDGEMTTLEDKLVKTRQLKQGMMHNLLTGKIRLT